MCRRADAPVGSWPQVISAHGLLFSCEARRQPGRGGFRGIERLTGVAKDSLLVAYHFVCLRAPVLSSWVVPGTPAGPLLLQGEELHLDLGHKDIPEDWRLGGAAAALAMVMALSGFDLLGPRLAVTGMMDLRGRVRSVGGLKETVTVAAVRGIDVLVVPFADMAVVPGADTAGEDLSLKLQEYARTAVKGAGTIVDILEYSIPGQPAVENTRSVYEKRLTC
jgi:ATP-dependent Lon protease